MISILRWFSARFLIVGFVVLTSYVVFRATPWTLSWILDGSPFQGSKLPSVLVDYSWVLSACLALFWPLALLVTDTFDTEDFLLGLTGGALGGWLQAGHSSDFSVSVWLLAGGLYGACLGLQSGKPPREAGEEISLYSGILAGTGVMLGVALDGWGGGPYCLIFLIGAVGGALVFSFLVRVSR